MKEASLVVLIYCCAACTVIADKSIEQNQSIVRAGNFVYDDKLPPIVADQFVYDTTKPVLRASEFRRNDNQ